jgi:hypothetical protein
VDLVSGGEVSLEFSFPVDVCLPRPVLAVQVALTFLMLTVGLGCLRVSCRRSFTAVSSPSAFAKLGQHFGSKNLSFRPISGLAG